MESDSLTRTILEEGTKQARRVFSLLVITSVTLFLGVSATDDRSIRRAIDSTESMIHASQTWSESWLEHVADERLAAAEEVAGPFSWPIGLPQALSVEISDSESGAEYPRTLKLDYFGPDRTLWGQGGVSTAQKTGFPDGYQYAYTVAAPTTISEFSEIWNSMAKNPSVIGLALPPNPVPIVVHTGHGSEYRAVDASLSWQPATFVEDEVGKNPVALLGAPSPRAAIQLAGRFQAPLLPRGIVHTLLRVGTSDVTHVLWVNPRLQGGGHWSSDLRIEVPLHVFYVPLKGVERLRDLIDPTLVVGPFSTAFPDLMDHTEGLEDLPLERTREYLLGRQRQQKREVTAMGLTFPAATLSTWGVAIIVSLQLYYYLLLRGLAQDSSGTGWRYPWLGLHPDSLGKAVFVLAGFALPFSASVTIGLYGFGVARGYTRPILVMVAILASALCSAAGLLAYVRLLRGLKIVKTTSANET